MAVIRECERVDNGVEVNSSEHKDEEGDGSSQPGHAAKKGRKVAELREQHRPGEEDDQGPYVEHLRKVDGSDVVFFVTQDDSSVPDNEGGERDEEEYLRPQIEDEQGNPGDSGLGDGDACDGKVWVEVRKMIWRHFQRRERETEASF